MHPSFRAAFNRAFSPALARGQARDRNARAGRDRPVGARDGGPVGVDGGAAEQRVDVLGQRRRERVLEPVGFGVHLLERHPEPVREQQLEQAVGAHDGQRGALAGGIVGLASAVGLVILSPAVWKTVLGNPAAIFPYDNPALFSMTAAFVVAIVVSKLDSSARAQKEAEAFEDQFVRAQTGLGAAAASKH